ncbi:hypothetical protein RCL1_007406 [Eukaryota sp. TZLM3-RCL]
MSHNRSSLSVIKTTKSISSSISLVEDSEGTRFCKKNIGRSLSKQEISFLSSLKHPGLVGYYSTAEQETNDLLFDYCEFGSFSDLDVSKQKLSSHDLWSIRNQILQALKYLASQGLYHKGLNVSNVLVCSLRRVHVKLSLFSNSQVLIDSVASNVPLQEFWKQKMIEQEEVCFDDLIRSIVKSVFPYSIIDKNIVFTNPNTLERKNLESLKALICSIESETMFKSGQCIGDFSSVNTTLSHVFNTVKSQECKNLFFSNTVLFFLFTQSILKFEHPLIVFEFDVDNSSFKWKGFSTFATKIVSTSSNFRNVFFRAFDFYCSSKGHVLVIGDHFFTSQTDLISRCRDISNLSSTSIVCDNWLKKFPITGISTSTLNFDTRLINCENITKLELEKMNEDLAAVTLFPNLTTFSSVKNDLVHDFSVLALCSNLRSISLRSCGVDMSTLFSSLELLTSLSLNMVTFVKGYASLSKLQKLKKLSANYCNISDLSVLSSLNQLTYLSLNHNKITDLTPLSSLKNLRTLCLNYNKISDITPLSTMTKLVKLDLVDTNVFDLWPLKDLMKLSRLEFTQDLLPKEHPMCFGMRKSRSEVKAVIYSFEKGVCGLDLSQRESSNVNLSLYSHCSRLLSLNLSNRNVENISEISNFTMLETLDLSIVTLPGNNKITDISFLSSCIKLRSLSLDGSKVTDLSPLSLLVELECLSLKDTSVIDLWPLKNLTKLSTLDVRETLLPRERQQELTNSSEIKQQINLFEYGPFNLDFSNFYGTIDLSLFSHYSKLKSLNLSNKRVEHMSDISKFTNLETLDLSNVKLPDNNKITDISFLSSCVNLISLSLECSKVTDLSPLSLLVELESLSLKDTSVFDLWPLRNLTKLSTLDVRETLLPRERQQELTNSSEIKRLINFFEHGFALDFSTFYGTIDLSLYSHCSRFKSLNLSDKSVENITEISNFTNLETLDLSNVKLPGSNKITDISFLTSCIHLKSLSLYGFKGFDNISTLWPIRFLTKLTTLDLRETLLKTEHQLLLNGVEQVQTFLSSVNQATFHLDLTRLHISIIIDLTLFTGFTHVKSLNLKNRIIQNISSISIMFPSIESIDLSAVKISSQDSTYNGLEDIGFLSPYSSLKSLVLDDTNVSNLRPLSSLLNLQSLSLKGTKVLDLSPLCTLHNLSTFDVRRMLLPYEKLFTNSNAIKDVINSFEYGVLDFSKRNVDCTIDLSLYPSFFNMKSLNLLLRWVKNITVISNFTSLETLDLSSVALVDDNYNKISDISFLSSCINLKSLYLDGSKVTDLGPLSSLSSLSHVSLNRTEVSDITPLVSSSYLKSLSLNNSLFSHLSQLSLFKQLESLSLNDNNITDTSPLSSIENLKVLSLCNNKISDLSPLSGLQFLEKLVIDDNQITNTTPISSLHNLTYLSLCKTQVADLSPIQNLTKLSHLDVRETLLPKQRRQTISELTCVQNFLTQSPSTASTITTCQNKLLKPNVPSFIDSDSNVYPVSVKNLPLSITEDLLRTVFSTVGTVVSLRIIRPFDQNSAHAFVNYSSEHSRDDAVNQLNGRLFERKRCRVTVSQGKYRKFNSQQYRN